MNYWELLNEYSKLIVENNNINDEQRKKDLAVRISEIEKRIISYREEQLKNGIISDELVNFFAQFDAYKGVVSDEKIEVQENKYNLSSDYIISELTGEKISLVGFSISTKIELIYEHTGELVASTDSIILQKMNSSFERFIESMKQNGGIERFKELYGGNWKEEVEKRYKLGYSTAIEHHIDNISDKVNDKRVELFKETEMISNEKESTKFKLEALKKEADLLNNECDKIKSLLGNMIKETDIQQQIRNTANIIDVPTETEHNQKQEDLEAVFGESIEQQQIRSTVNINDIPTEVEHSKKQEDLDAVVGLTCEEVDNELRHFGTNTSGDDKPYYNDPVKAEKLNNIYMKLTGFSHPNYDNYQYESVVNYLNNEYVLTQFGGKTEKYFDELRGIVSSHKEDWPDLQTEENKNQTR